jgi:C1A family cysteine protease
MKKSILFFGMLISLNAFSSRISELNALILKNGANWVAKESHVSQLSQAEIKRLLGSNEKPTGDALFYNRNFSTNAIDWRNVNGQTWLSPIMNQGNCGSCVAFATVASLETRFKIASGMIWANPTFSPQQLFICGGGACDTGWFPQSAARFVKKSGIVDDACVPYTSGVTGVDVSCRAMKCDNKEKRLYKVSNYESPSFRGGNAESVKAALKNGPLVTTMTVYDDFMSYGGGIYKAVSRKTVGGHAISLIGFNDQERYWIIRNSWGEDWGENGFARISYDDKSGIAESTIAFLLNENDKYATITNPENHSYVSGVIQVEVKTKKSNHPKVSILIKNEAETMNLDECVYVDDQTCRAEFDATKLRDGRFEINAISEERKLEVKEILVLNHNPNSKINFRRADGKPFSTPFVDRIEFNIDVFSNAVMPQKITFYLTNLEGKVVAKRTSNLVLEHMKLGFRFNTVPNGQYKIFYKVSTPFEGKDIEETSNVEAITTKN